MKDHIVPIGSSLPEQVSVKFSTGTVIVTQAEDLILLDVTTARELLDVLTECLPKDSK